MTELGGRGRNNERRLKSRSRDVSVEQQCVRGSKEVELTGLRRHRNNESDNTDRSGDDDVPVPLVGLVGVSRYEESADSGEGEGRSAEEEGVLFRIAEGSSELREELIERKSDSHARKTQGHDPHCSDI